MRRGTAVAGRSVRGATGADEVTPRRRLAFHVRWVRFSTDPQDGRPHDVTSSVIGHPRLEYDSHWCLSAKGGAEDPLGGRAVGEGRA